MSALPDEYKINEPVEPFKKNVVNNLVSVSPKNSQTYSQGQTIEVELPQSQWLNPTSLSLNYKLLVNTNAAQPSMIGVPAYCAFSKLEVLADGNVIDCVNNYNQICQMVVSGTLDVAQKAGNTGYGYLSNHYLTDFDGRLFTANLTDTSADATIYLSVPLIANVIANSTKNLPLFCMPKITFRFTIGNINDMYVVTAGSGTFTKYEISQFYLSYESSSLGNEVERLVSKSNIKIKSFGYANSGNTILAGSNNTQQIVFNAPYASLKAAFLLCTRGNATGSKWGEFSDITSGAGEFQFKIGNNSLYPQKALSTTFADSSIMNEFKRCMSKIYKTDGKSMCINSAEYGVTINTLTASTLYYQPGKFIPSYAFNGENTFSDPLTAVIQMNTATLINCNVNLVVCFDSILNIDPINKKLTISK
jgi:hypothetical protein